MCIRDRYMGDFQILSSTLITRPDAPKVASTPKGSLGAGMKYEQLRRALAVKSRDELKVLLQKFQGKYTFTEADFRMLWSEKRFEVDRREYVQSLRRVERHRKPVPSIHRALTKEQQATSIVIVQGATEENREYDLRPLPARQLLQRNLQKRFASKKADLRVVRNIQRSLIRLAGE
eukprot:TRINITY_DN13193_c0_g1_i2.p1 TRINITY_DN13193_c0_g1~~TRINITY_DN13193_c0_g1_i2.p1  ORF type:complete len:196 (+),score=32.40 TRINITY_DN13193_c0_g1_i2:61-588(+)